MSEPDDWIAGLPETRRTDIAAIDERIRAVAPDLRRYMAGGMIAYGRYRYRYASKREGDWPVLGVASNKAYISLYASPVGVEPWAGRLPKANVGKGCIRFRHASDLDLDVIDEVIAAAAAKNGTLIESGV
jgi:uncharacterized protein YdhG (YjbR/CyaY superfamily)